MSAPPIQLDFVSRPRHGGLRGLAILTIGVAATAWTVLAFRTDQARVAGLELRLEALAPRAAAQPADSKAEEQLTRILTDVRGAAAELNTPWSLLLTELEEAGKDSNGAVAVISIEPDRAQRKVRLRVEARSFPAGFAYVQRLQSSRALRFPLLDTHEVQTRVSERPVRLQITADWRQTS
jgi:hypothetical protein